MKNSESSLPTLDAREKSVPWYEQWVTMRTMVRPPPVAAADHEGSEGLAALATLSQDNCFSTCPVDSKPRSDFHPIVLKATTEFGAK